jgi:phosphoribosyl-ATP pyrophosphohydrolase
MGQGMPCPYDRARHALPLRQSTCTGCYQENSKNLIHQLFATITDRKAHPKEGSYTNLLLDAGEDEILKKIGEESVEVILAAKAQGDERLISEMADLTYHCLVLLAERGLTPDDIAAELKRRHAPAAGEKS